MSLSVSGLPSGANATFSTNPISDGSGTRRKLYAQDYRNQRKHHPLHDGHFGCELLLDIGYSAFANGHARQQHGLHSDRNSGQRLQRVGDVPGARVTV